MTNSLVYLTRRCSRKCKYCSLRDSNLTSPELTSKQWQEAFIILKNMGVDFNLILGNECWLLGEDLLPILGTGLPYAIYTTAPEPLFSSLRDKLFQGGLDNLSCGVDYPYSYLKSIEPNFTDHSENKSLDGWNALMWVKKHYPNVDTQANATIHKKNFKLIPQLLKEAAEQNIFTGVNFIHWNKDGNFDFFPDKKYIEDYTFTKEDLPELQKMIDEILEIKGTIQNLESLRDDLSKLISMDWHCNGNPYGGPSVDSDGSLRCCGYRRGTRTPKISIFDLKDPDNIKLWKDAVYFDCMDCPGCSWSYPRMHKYWRETNSEFGKKVFSKHAGNHIEKTNWSKRKYE